MRKRLTKKPLHQRVDYLEKELHSQRGVTNSILEILQASGIIDALNGEDSDIISVDKTSALGFGAYKVHYKVNEVF